MKKLSMNELKLGAVNSDRPDCRMIAKRLSLTRENDTSTRITVGGFACAACYLREEPVAAVHDFETSVASTTRSVPELIDAVAKQLIFEIPCQGDLPGVGEV